MFGSIVNSIAGIFTGKPSSSSAKPSSSSAASSGNITADQLNAWYAATAAQNAAFTSQLIDEFSDLAARNQLVTVAAANQQPATSPMTWAALGLVGLALVLTMRD